MNNVTLVGNIAVDKNSSRLGKIVRIEKLLGKTIKKYVPCVMILIERRFKKNLVIPLEISKILKVQGDYVWFNITKEEFDIEVERYSKIQKEREIYSGDIGVHHGSGVTGFSFDYYRVSRRLKERKK
ncbi:MAG: hypothetical protein ACFFDW_12765 [Candidatus Thorarchaeota archaeon]